MAGILRPIRLRRIRRAGAALAAGCQPRSGGVASELFAHVDRIGWTGRRDDLARVEVDLDPHVAAGVPHARAVGVALEEGEEPGPVALTASVSPKMKVPGPEALQTLDVSVSRFVRRTTIRPPNRTRSVPSSPAGKLSEWLVLRMSS